MTHAPNPPDRTVDAVPLRYAAATWGTDVIVTDGPHVYQIDPDGQAWALTRSSYVWPMHPGSLALQALVTPIAYLTQGATTTPEPTEPGSVVDCTVDGYPSRAMRAHYDTLPWVVTRTDETSGPVWRAWDDLDNPTPRELA